MAALLSTAAIGTAFWLFNNTNPPAFPFGPVLLVAAALFLAIIPAWWAALPGTFGAVYASAMILTRWVPQLVDSFDAGLALGRGLQLISAVTALVAGGIATRSGYLLSRAAARESHSPTKQGATREGSGTQVIALLILAPICAEYLAAYLETTGDLVQSLGGLLIFTPLYGAPALLIREVARRGSLGWPGMMLMGAAFGLIQAGVVDQSLFSSSYSGIEGWGDSREPTLIPRLGFSLQMAEQFIMGHAIYSICAPIALVEALRPSRQHDPWLGPRGLVIAALLYIAASILVLQDHLATEDSHASALQVIASLVISCGLIAVAVWSKHLRNRTGYGSGAPSPTILFGLAFAGATLLMFVPESWSGAVLSIGFLATAAAATLIVSRRADWDIRHPVAIAAALLINRALFAFTYFPLVGEVDPAAKYGHNIVLLALVLALSVLAFRNASAFSRQSFTAETRRDDETV